MFCTVNDVKQITGYDVDDAAIYRAQTIIESYVKRIEGEITNAVDLELLARATAFQTAYMANGADKVYEQISAIQIGQNSSLVTFRSQDTDSPWIAPMAKIACKGLTWRKSRGVKVGRTIGKRFYNYLDRWYSC